MRRGATKTVHDFKDIVSVIVQVEKTKQKWSYDVGSRFALAILVAI